MIVVDGEKLRYGLIVYICLNNFVFENLGDCFMCFCFFLELCVGSSSSVMFNELSLV